MKISTELRVKAYRMMPEAETINTDLGFHAQVIPFDGFEDVSNAIDEPVEIFGLPNPVEFQGLLSTVRQTDLPVIKELWPVMSKRMLEVLKSVGFFPHRVIPARIIEGTIGRSISEKARHCDELGNLKSEFYTDDYILIQLTEHLDAIDLERSIYERYNPKTNMILGIEKYVFKDIGQEYPPIFRPTHCPTELFISDAAKKALEKSKVRGLWLIDYGE
jgi:hypothetical protein